MSDYKFNIGDKVDIVDPMTIVSSGRMDGENVYGVKRASGGITTLREDDIKLSEKEELYGETSNSNMEQRYMEYRRYIERVSTKRVAIKEIKDAYEKEE